MQFFGVWDLAVVSSGSARGVSQMHGPSKLSKVSNFRTIVPEVSLVACKRRQPPVCGKLLKDDG